jgi:uncharacterized protein (TIGR00255 family)
MNSMTGFGRGDAAADGTTWSVEISSVNRKQLEVAASLPRELADLEPQVRSEVSARCSRGRVNVVIRSDARSTGNAALKLDETLVQQYLTEARRLATVLGVEPQISLADAMRWPGVLATETVSLDAEAAWPLIQRALQAALIPFLASRATEGAALKTDIESRLATVTALLADISTRAPEIPAQHRKALLQRLEDAGLSIDLKDDRLIKEIALFADRCDISEELTRARSHLAQFAKQLAATEALGRNMDFLAQELFREFNTMGAKANNAELTHLIVQAKTEIEKVREQVQNVE